MIEITLIALKFAALIVGGVFAAIGLLTNYRNEDKTVSKWGKIALFGIVLSTIIGAGTQAVESYRNRAAALANDAANRKSEEQSRKSEEQTRNVLAQLKRALYPLRGIALHSLRISYPTDNVIISTPLDRLDLASPNPGKYTYSDSPDIIPGGPHYPSEGVLLHLIEPHVQVSLWRKSASPLQEPDLQFDLHLHKTRASLIWNTLYVSVGHVPVPDDSLNLSQEMASLEDVRGGKILLRILVWADNPDNTGRLHEIYPKVKIEDFALSIANHEIRAEVHPLPPRALGFEFEGLTSAPQDDPAEPKGN